MGPPWRAFAPSSGAVPVANQSLTVNAGCNSHLEANREPNTKVYTKSCATQVKEGLRGIVCELPCGYPGGAGASLQLVEKGQHCHLLGILEGDD